MTTFLNRPAGAIGYDVHGAGPLVVCVPGMGELRSSYRHTVPALVDAGYRVATFDLRGHGDSATTFDTFDDQAAASDLLALIDELGGGPALIVGNSMGAAAAVLVAVERPAAVSGLVLIGPFVRDPELSPVKKFLFKYLLRGFWGRAAFRSYHKSMTPSGDQADIAAHRDEVMASHRDAQHWHAVQQTATTSHAAAAAVLASVRAPVLVVMGTKDPDFPDPAGEAGWVAQALDGGVLLVDGAGHYPMAEQPGVVNPAVLDFAAEHHAARNCAADA